MIERRLSMCKGSVLVVDDELNQCLAYVSILKLLGYNAVSALNGDEALKLFKSDINKFDLVIVDYNMPGMNGIELCEKLKSIRSVSVLMCTGSSGDVKTRDQSSKTPDETQIKPVDMPIFVESVDRFMALAAVSA